MNFHQKALEAFGFLSTDYQIFVFLNVALCHFPRVDHQQDRTPQLLSRSFFLSLGLTVTQRGRAGLEAGHGPMWEGRARVTISTFGKLLL